MAGGAIVAAFFLAPYVVMFLGAVKSQQDLFHNPALYLPTHWQWSNFAHVWKIIPLATYLVNSLIVAAVSTAIVLLVSLPAAYYTARHNFRGKRAFLYLVLITQMFAPVALVIGIYREVTLVNGAVNSYWALIAVDSAFNLAFSIWILNGYLASIPKEIEDAAMVDGAGAADHVPGGAAAGQAGHRDRGDLHVHPGLERVRGRGDDLQQPDREPGDTDRRH